MALVMMSYPQPAYASTTPTIIATTSITAAIDNHLNSAGITNITTRQNIQNIAYCESRDRQFNSDGSLLEGIVDSDDVGIFQINEHYNPYKTAIKQGFDYHTVEGNIDYAIEIYKERGTTPWNASRDCWNQSLVAVK